MFSTKGEVSSIQGELNQLHQKGFLQKGTYKKIVLDHSELAIKVKALRDLDAETKIVVTIGSFDLFHNGQGRYLEKARMQGTHLIVGVDSDAAVKRYKNEYRPIIPAVDRIELLARQSYVDYVTIIQDVDSSGNWHFGLLRAIKPDVFIAEETSYSKEQKEEIEELCRALTVLPRQSETTSATNILRKIITSPEIAEQIISKRSEAAGVGTLHQVGGKNGN